ncbi:MAG: hypothetical protein ABI895_00530 [Deltaproteobacteria bacterium]
MTAAALRVPSLTGALLGCCSLADKTLRAKLADRLSTLISVVVAALGYCIFLLVWAAVYRENPHGVLLPKGELFPYLVVALVFNSTFSLAVEFRFGLRLRQGLIATDLIRPLGFLPFQLAQAVGDALGNLLFSAPIYAVGWLFLGAAVLPVSRSAARRRRVAALSRHHRDAGAHLAGAGVALGKRRAPAPSIGLGGGPARARHDHLSGSVAPSPGAGRLDVMQPARSEISKVGFYWAMYKVALKARRS